MSLRISGSRDFPTRINLSGLKSVQKEDIKALSAIMLAKAASQGSFEDVAALWAGVNSNANIAEPIAELTQTIHALMSALSGDEGEE